MASSFFLDSTGAQKKIEDITKQLKGELDKTLAKALTDERDEIVKRTQSGEGLTGKFKSYSKAYANYRAKKGRKSSVDLTFTGSMLRSIQTKVERVSGGLLGTLFFPANQRDKARGNQALRKFFGLKKEQLDRINKKILEAINGRR